MFIKCEEKRAQRYRKAVCPPVLRRGAVDAAL